MLTLRHMEWRCAFPSQLEQTERFEFITYPHQGPKTISTQIITMWLFHRKKLFYREKKSIRYIHPRTLYVGFTVRVGAKLRC